MRKAAAALKMALHNWTFVTDEGVDGTSLAGMRRGVRQPRATEKIRQPSLGRVKIKCNFSSNCGSILLLLICL